jgi:hypothetical protein
MVRRGSAGNVHGVGRNTIRFDRGFLYLSEMARGTVQPGAWREPSKRPRRRPIHCSDFIPTFSMVPRTEGPKGPDGEPSKHHSTGRSRRNSEELNRS